MADVPDRRPIRPLPPDLRHKIAAGEVIERPASAVKELLDNAVDAGARHINAEIREGGLKLIRVSDDGCGIPGADVPLAFASHSTSKIRTLDDLEQLATLGFRGEALPSIGAVARVRLQTRCADEEAGTRFELEYGEQQSIGPCSAPVGVRIAVHDLFGNVPARRKFVRSLRAEAGQIASVVMQYALAQPAIALTLTVDDRLAFTSPGTGEVQDALAAVYGPDVVADMLPVRHVDDGVLLRGLVSAPGLTRPNRSAIHIAVNGRPVGNRSLPFALEEAYSGFLMTGRHPLAVVNLTLPPSDVDANVHPSKGEVRFARERAVHGAVYRAVASALLERRMMEVPGQVEPNGGSAAGTPAEEALFDLDEATDTGLSADAQRDLLPSTPVLRVFGQTNATFIVAEGPQGLYMIDQHAAHERILFDELEERLTAGEIPSQPLLEPISLPLQPAQMAALEDHRELLHRAGFVLEPFGLDAGLVRAVPALPSRSGPEETVLEVLSELVGLPEPAAARERALAAMACKAAVKAGQALDVQEMRELVRRLERTLRPATCPHGRPTMIHLSHVQLEREFGRR